MPWPRAPWRSTACPLAGPVNLPSCVGSGRPGPIYPLAGPTDLITQSRIHTPCSRTCNKKVVPARHSIHSRQANEIHATHLNSQPLSFTQSPTPNTGKTSNMSCVTLLYSPSTPSKPHLSISRSRPPKTHLSSSSSFVSRHSSKLFPPLSSSVPLLRSIRQSKRRVIRAAYISAPASDPNISGIDEEEDPDGHQSRSQTTMVDSSIPISWGYLWSLLMKHKLRLAASIVALVGCTSCTLSMPIFSGLLFFSLFSNLDEQ